MNENEYKAKLMPFKVLLQQCRDENAAMKASLRDAREVLAHAVDTTDESCQCGYFEVEGQDDDTMSICWKCRAEELLKAPSSKDESSKT